MEIPANSYSMETRLFHLPLLLVLTSVVMPGLSAQPVITSVVNAASYADPQLPGSLIPPGSIFVVFGTGLGPAEIAIAPAAFQSTSLSGTSVSVTVNGQTVNALMYYTSATLVAALLPSKTPAAGMGTANPNAQVTITVTYNGEDSAPTPFQGVGGSSVGLFTVNSSGSGPAIVTYLDYSLVSAAKAANCGGPNTACGSANAGDILTLWATGLGPVPNDGPSSLGMSFPFLPLTVWVGGVQAPVVYQGRSGCCIGLDQIIFTVPTGVPSGCAVPLMVQIANGISNSTVIPVANGSRTCTPADPTIAAANMQQWASLPSPTLGIAHLNRFVNAVGSGYTSRVKFTFLRASSGIPQALQPFFVSYLDQPPVGTCTIVPSGFANSPGNYSPIETFFQNLNLASIDAGSRFTIAGPKGTYTVTGDNGDWVSMPLGDFFVDGAYTITGGPGNDVGAFGAQLTIPSELAFTSPASANNLVVTRSQGMTVTWNPSGLTGSLQIALSAWTSTSMLRNVICTVVASAGTFTIPPYAMLTLPPTNGTLLSLRPGVALWPVASALFTASGLDAGIVQASTADDVSIGLFVLK